MYNEEQKRDFLNQYSKSKSGLEAYARAFNAMQKYEEEWGADLCTRTKEELEPAVNSVLGVRSQGKGARMALYKAYVQWCLENGVEGACDGMMYVDISDAKKMVEQMVTAPRTCRNIWTRYFTRSRKKQLTISIGAIYGWLLPECRNQIFLKSKRLTCASRIFPSQ